MAMDKEKLSRLEMRKMIFCKRIDNVARKDRLKVKSLKETIERKRLQWFEN